MDLAGDRRLVLVIANSPQIDWVAEELLGKPVAIGRGVRYVGEGLLALWYGDRALTFLQENAHTVGLWLGVAVLVGGTAFIWWRRNRAAKLP